MVLAVGWPGAAWASDGETPANHPGNAADATNQATLELIIEEVGVRVSIDGRVLGMSPIPPQVLAPGRHVLALDKEGFEPQARVLDLEAGPFSLPLRLVRSDCRLSVGADSTQPLELLVDGRFAGTLPWTGTVLSGAHELTTRSATTSTIPQTVTCASGTAITVSLDASLRSGVLELGVDPDVHVFVDLHDEGFGSRRMDLPSGRHQVELLRPGFRPWRRELSLPPGGALRLAPRDFVPDISDRSGASRGGARRFRGVYGRVGLAFLLGTGRGSDAISRDCPAEQARGGCSSTGPFNGNLLLSIGYGLGWLGAELFGGFMGQVSNVDANYRDSTAPGDASFYGLAREENHTFARYGFILGAGIRGTTPTTGIRATMGLGLGLARQTTRYVRASDTVTVVPAYGNSTEHRLPDGALDDEKLGTTSSPCLVSDLGILLGGSPGTKLELSLTLLVQWPSAPSVPASERKLGYGTTFSPSAGGYPKAPNGSPAFESARGVEWFIGPRLGLQFGY